MKYFNRSFGRFNGIFLALAMLPIFFSACAHKSEQRVEPKDQVSVAPPEKEKDTAASKEKPAPGDYGPQPIFGPDIPPKGFEDIREVGVTLVFLPAMAKAWAYVGVIKELEEQKIPIRAIVGMETGALVGALYALRGLHGLQWQLSKFQEETFLDIPLLSLKPRAAGNELQSLLQKIFRETEIQNFKIPVRIAVSDKEDHVAFPSKGRVTALLRSAMALPEVMDPSSAKERCPWPREVDLVREAIALQRGKIIVVDPFAQDREKDLQAFNLGEAGRVTSHLRQYYETVVQEKFPTSEESWSDLEDNAKALLSLQLADLPLMDFNSRAELLYRGVTATKAWMKESQ